MLTLSFEVAIAATPTQVWFFLWNDYSYRYWTAAFMPGSHAISNWQVDSRIYFLGPDGRGMYADIVQQDPPRSMVFCHRGQMVNGQEAPPPAGWQDAEESYFLEAQDTGTLLRVTVQSLPEYATMLNKKFPEALNRLKALAEKGQITVQTEVSKPVGLVWEAWTNPQHIIHWNFASPEWQCPRAEADLHPGGRFSSRMEARDGSMGFDFEGTYTVVEPASHLAYTMDDGRQVSIHFQALEQATHITQSFDPEQIHSYDLQYQGWLAIQQSFGRYAEALG